MDFADTVDAQQPCERKSWLDFVSSNEAWRDAAPATVRDMYRRGSAHRQRHRGRDAAAAAEEVK